MFNITKSYVTGNYIYATGGGQQIPVYERRVLTKIKNEIRSPDSNELARLLPNSSVVFKITRPVNLVLPTADSASPTPQQKSPSSPTDKQEKMVETLAKSVDKLATAVREQQQDHHHHSNEEEKTPEGNSSGVRKNNGGADGNGEEKQPV
tara:strand:- start:3 stop:452 length:450 start_codon:yes stop_codon:yes gene_type:complete